MIIDMAIPIYTAEQLNFDVKKLAEVYHTIIQYVTIGVSHDNRDILMLKLGTGKNHILFTSGVHGRETINPIVLMALTEYYGIRYLKYEKLIKQETKVYHEEEQTQEMSYSELIFGKCIYELLKTYTFLIIPLLNPDGYMISLQGFEALKDEELRKKARECAESPYLWKYNGRGVDINRNFPSVLWRAKNEQDYAASENETKALISVFHQYDLKGFIDIHSRGKSIYYYRQRMSEEYNERQLKIATRLKDVLGYSLVSPEEEIDPGDTGGNTVHYFSEHFYQVALTIETVDEDASFPLDHSYRQTTYKELKFLFFEVGIMLI